MNWRAMGILAASGCISSSAWADGFYMSEKASAVNFNDVSSNIVVTVVDSANPANNSTTTTVLAADSSAATNLDLIVGYEFNDFFAIEAGVSGSLSEGKFSLAAAAAPTLAVEFEGLEFDSLQAYAVFKTPTNPYFKAKAGYSKNEFEHDGLTAVVEEDSTSYGLGVGYKFKSGIRLELEATVLSEAFATTTTTTQTIGTITATGVGTVSYDDLIAVQLGISVPFESDEVGGFVDQSKFYYGINLNSADLDNNGAAVIDTNGIGFKVGREFGKFMSAEFHYGVTADSTDNVIDDPEINYSAIFARFNLPFENVNLYALIGRSEVDVSIAGGLNATEKDFAQGIGLDLIANDTLSLHVESVTYGDDQFAPELKMLSVGFTKRFDFPSIR